MSDSGLKLPYPPIVEAILDIECDLPPGQQLAALESAVGNRFREKYPKMRSQFVQEHLVEAKQGETPKMAVRHGLSAFQLLQDDEKQLVQVRSAGYSFNRLAPYSGLDDYLPEIERTWRLYCEIISPVTIRLIRLRYINRIMLPFAEKAVRLEDYLQIGPRLPDEQILTLTGFLSQHTAVERATGHQVSIVLTAQGSEGNNVPIIFDNCVAAPGPAEPADWPWILEKIRALRVLKNRIFEGTLTKACLNLFQQPS
jgi:uncharacterized protein (TIGR04255 family)